MIKPMFPLKVKGRFVMMKIVNNPGKLGKSYFSWDIYLKTADGHQFVAEFEDRLMARIARRALEDARKCNAPSRTRTF